MGKVSKLIRPEHITVHYVCCECGAKYQELLSEVTDTTFLCDECDELENYMEITGVYIKEPETKKNVKLKKICFKCSAFDKTIGAHYRYKCAAPNTCPGLNWSEKKKQQAIRNRRKK